ncbi:MAG: hypothetical protein ACPKQO_09580 [Nitrososphaeraceae archaeon]
MCVFSAIFTATSGLLHLFMVGPYLKPINFPMELLSYTDTLYIISGILQVLWFIPMIKNWDIKWPYVGVIGTVLLAVLLYITRIPNPITVEPLVDVNPMYLLTEIFQLLYLFVPMNIMIFKKTNKDIQLFFLK